VTSGGTTEPDGAVAEPRRALARAGALYSGYWRLAGDLAGIALGASPVSPAADDWRFRDRAWAEHPFYRRLAQAYTASCVVTDETLDDLARTGRASPAARFLLTIAQSAAAPTNTLLGNPAAMKRAYETGGLSLLRGLKNFAGDVRHNGGMPSTVDRSGYQVGRDFAITPGAVVDRDPYAEVIQYVPSTGQVQARPVLIVPPPIGRYYFLDLRPGRSMVEYAVSRGLQTFMLSWRNPTREQAGWDLDTYAGRVLTAIETVRKVTGAPDIDVIGFCAGGILTTLALNHLAALGQAPVHSASYAVTLLDWGQEVPVKAFSASRLLALARWNSARAGVISARDMGGAFTWMRPDDLVWKSWVNNYLMGDKPPAFDILAWNADGTNLPATLHAQFLDIFEHNPLVTPGTVTCLGTPVDLSTITLPSYVTGGVTDHLTPWTSCYRTTQLLGGPSTFVLSNAGHIQSLVNPPGNPKAVFWTGAGPLPRDPEAWLAAADKHTGTWWTHWADWVIAQSAGTKAAPSQLGTAEHPPLEDAPGCYVRDLLPATAER
jgi:polyhydroxyalkanoate synthase subunit PhaC